MTPNNNESKKNIVKKKIIISMCAIVLLILTIYGITYAYFATKVKENENDTSVKISAASLKLEYDGEDSYVKVEKLYPGEEVANKKFSVKNTGTATVYNYDVILENLVNELSLYEDLKYELSCTSSDGKDCNNSTGIFPKTNQVIVTNTIDSKVTHSYVLKLIYEETNTDQSIDMNKEISAKVNIGATNSETNPFGEGTLAYNILENSYKSLNGTTYRDTPLTKPAEEKSDVTSYKSIGQELTTAKTMSISNYTSSTWYYYDTYEINSTTGKFTLSGKHSCTYNSTTTNTDGETINCYDDMVNKYLYSISASSNSNANSHTAETKTNLLEVYKVESATASELKYLKVFSDADIAEKVLAQTQDDYVTSYYFRGDVEDNYVNFADMCWRIVRIVGDGSVKLILEDKYTTCDDTETETTSAVYTGNWNIGTGNYGYDSSSKSTSGSTLYKMNYLNPVTKNTSSMVKAFYDFQTTKLSDYTGKLKAGDWCLGDKAYTRSGSSGSYTYTLLEDTSSNYLSKTSFYYDAYTRLTNGIANGYQPTLKCNGTILSEFADVSGVSSKAPMYVSAITADEIVFAGGKFTTMNYNYYLMNNYSKGSYSFLSLSPYYFNGSSDGAFLLSSDGNMNQSSVGTNIAFRPSVSLKPRTVIKEGGEGTIENPYVVE